MADKTPQEREVMRESYAAALALPVPDTIAHAVRERDGWINSAAMFHINAEYYRDIVDEIGAMLGPDAYTADDGMVHDTVLRSKVAELVRARIGAPVAAE
jgi:hypothetical protein